LKSFVKGDHPLYNGKNGTPLVKLDSGKTSRFYEISPETTASIFRSSLDFNQSTMVIGIASEVFSTV
ncbi:MAG: hypothetical protein ACK559_24660, partial [bacterium]